MDAIQLFEVVFQILFCNKDGQNNMSVQRIRKLRFVIRSSLTGMTIDSKDGEEINKGILVLQKEKKLYTPNR